MTILERINIHEAKARLSHYARKVKAGETIILCDRNHPFAEIRPLRVKSKSGKRILGKFKGQCPVTESFFAADSEIADSFVTGSVFPQSSASDCK